MVSSAGATRGALGCRSPVRAAAIAMMMAGCGATPPLQAPVAAARRASEACDLEVWREAAQATQRAWLAALIPPAAHREPPLPGGTERDDRPVIVMALDRDVRVASIRDGVIVARWVSPAAFGRAAMAEVGVSASPGGPPDPARKILVGHPLPATEGEWLMLREVEGLTVEGVVPARIRGTIWEEPAKPPPEVRRTNFSGVIRAEASPEGVPRARTSRSVLRANGLAPPGWAAVVAQTRYAIVRGFIELPPPPPPPPPRPPGGDEPSEIESEIEWQPEPGPFSPGTCVHDAPGGNVVGMVLDDLPLAVEKTPVRGWYRFTLPTPWGRTPYYTRSAPRPPKPREEPKPWNGWPAPAYDWSRELR